MFALIVACQIYISSGAACHILGLSLMVRDFRSETEGYLFESDC